MQFLKRAGFFPTPQRGDEAGPQQRNGIYQVKRTFRCCFCGREVQAEAVAKASGRVKVMFRCTRHGAIPRAYDTVEG